MSPKRSTNNQESDATRTHPAASRSERYSVRYVRGMAGLLELESQWRDLETRLSVLRFYHAFDWYQAALHARLIDGETLFFVVSSPERVCLIAPLCHTRRRVAGVGLRCWEIPQHPHLALSDILMDAREGEEALAFLLHCLRREAPLDWDCIHFPRRLSDASAPTRGPGDVGLPCLIRPIGQNKYLRCATTGEAPPARRLRRAIRWLEANGAAELHVTRHGMALESAFVQFLKLEKDSWKGERGSAIAQSRDLTGFYRRLIALGTAQAETDDTRLAPAVYRLGPEGRPAAAVFALTCGRTCYLLKIAWAPWARAGSPGHVLIEKTRQYWCGGDPARELNFVTGVDWVDSWKPQARPVSSWRWYNRSWRGRLVCHMERLRQTLRIRVRLGKGGAVDS